MLTATIEFAEFRTPAQGQWIVRCYGQKGWNLHQGVPSFYRTEAAAINARNEFLGA